MRFFIVLFVVMASLHASLAQAAPAAFSSSRIGGGHHGHRTDLLIAASSFLYATGSRNADLVCPLKRILGPNPLAGVTRRLTAELLPAAPNAAAILRDPAQCIAWERSRTLSPPPLRPPVSIPFPVDAHGIPVSSNAVWNRCIASPTYVPLELIRSNPDRTAANARGTITRPKTCGDYYFANGRWKHPDFPQLEYFTFTLRPRPALITPYPYVPVVKKDAANAGWAYAEQP